MRFKKTLLGTNSDYTAYTVYVYICVRWWFCLLFSKLKQIFLFFRQLDASNSNCNSFFVVQLIPVLTLWWPTALREWLVWAHRTLIRAPLHAIPIIDRLAVPTPPVWTESLMSYPLVKVRKRKHVWTGYLMCHYPSAYVFRSSLPSRL